MNERLPTIKQCKAAAHGLVDASHYAFAADLFEFDEGYSRTLRISLIKSLKVAVEALGYELVARVTVTVDKAANASVNDMAERT